MLVNYTKPRACTVHAGKGTKFIFAPGVNEIPNELWKNFEANPNFKKRLSRGDFVVVSDAASDADQTSLEKVSGVAEAKKLIRETYDEALLKEWRAQENRKTVIQTIDEQLTAIKQRLNRKRQAE